MLERKFWFIIYFCQSLDYDFQDKLLSMKEVNTIDNDYLQRTLHLQVLKFHSSRSRTTLSFPTQ